MEIRLFCATLFIIVPCSSCAKWIDPFGMESETIERMDYDCPQQETPSGVIASYYVRTISLLLNSLKYDKEFAAYRASFNVDLSPSDYEFVKNFLTGSMEDEGDWATMDKILVEVFSSPPIPYFQTMASWADLISHIILSREAATGFGILCLLWLFYKLKNAKITLWIAFKYFIVFFYLIDFVHTWIYMLKEKELEQLLHVAYTGPPQCDVKKMSYGEYVAFITTSVFGKDNCKEYHKIKDIDFFWSVSPSQVFGAQMGNLILAPADKIGQAFGKMMSAVMVSSSWYLMIPMLLMIPLLLFALLLGGCVFLSFVTGRCFAFNLLHLIQFSFGKPAEEAPSAKPTKSNQINLILPGSKSDATLHKALKSAIEVKKTPPLELPATKPEIEEFVEDERSETDISEEPSDYEVIR